jgi:hypothetical protein
MFFEKCAVYEKITGNTEELEESETLRHICVICKSDN